MNNFFVKLFRDVYPKFNGRKRNFPLSRYLANALNIREDYHKNEMRAAVTRGPSFDALSSKDLLAISSYTARIYRGIYFVILLILGLIVRPNNCLNEK